MKKRVGAFIVSFFIAASAAASELQLQTIGASTASNLYLSYLSIGVIADSYTKNVYSKEQTLSFVSSVVAQGGVQKDYLQKMIDGGDIPEGEKEFVNKLIRCFQLIMDEGNSLMDYVKTGDNVSLTKYDAKRKEAWTLISEIMGFGKK